MAKDWTKLYKKYKGQWVALADDEETVVGHGPTVKAAIKSAKGKSTEEILLTLVPDNLEAFVG
jgi:hypothetical protein